MTQYLLILTLGLYFLCTLFQVIQVIFAKRALGQVSLPLLVFAFLLLSVYGGYDLLGQGFPYFKKVSDSFYFIAWLLSLTFILLNLKFHPVGAGIFFVPTSFFFLCLGFVYHHPYAFFDMNNPILVIHLPLALLAFTTLMLSFVVGCLYVFREWQLKHKKPSLLQHKLPSLEMMDLIHFRALTLGFIFLSLAIIAGAFLSHQTQGSFFTTDPKQLGALIAWGIYAVLLNVRTRSGWRGRRGIFLSILGFVVVLLTFWMSSTR